MLMLAVLLGLLATIANASVYWGFGSAATATFMGFIAVVTGILFVAAVGCLLSPERVGKYYDRTKGWLDHLKAALDSQCVARGKQGGPADVDLPTSTRQLNYLGSNILETLSLVWLVVNVVGFATKAATTSNW